MMEVSAEQIVNNENQQCQLDSSIKNYLNERISVLEQKFDKDINVYLENIKYDFWDCSKDCKHN